MDKLAAGSLPLALESLTGFNAFRADGSNPRGGRAVGTGDIAAVAKVRSRAHCAVRADR
jgi:hypothetical protein